MVDYESLLTQATESIRRLTTGTKFLLKDLYQGAYWNGLDRGVRLELGRRFKYGVKKGEFSNVKHIGKAQNNSALYEKMCNGND